MKKSTIGIVMLLFVAMTCVQANVTWDGDINLYWENATNWDDGSGDPSQYPGETGDTTTGTVLINNGNTVTLGGSGADIPVNYLTSRATLVESGSSLIINDGSSMGCVSGKGASAFQINARENATQETLVTLNGSMDLYGTSSGYGNIEIGRYGDTSSIDGIGEGARLQVNSTGDMKVYSSNIGQFGSGISSATLEVNGGTYTSLGDFTVYDGRGTGLYNQTAIAPKRVISISGAANFDIGKTLKFYQVKADTNIDFELNIIGSTATKIEFNDINLNRLALPGTDPTYGDRVHECTVSFSGDNGGFKAINVVYSLKLTNDWNDLVIDGGSWTPVSGDITLFTYGSLVGEFSGVTLLGSLANAECTLDYGDGSSDAIVATITVPSVGTVFLVQ